MEIENDCFQFIVLFIVSISQLKSMFAALHLDFKC